jgi:hypothetical protein
MKKLIEFATRFKGFLGFAAFILLVLIFLATYLFSQGSFDQILAGFTTLSPTQFLSVVYLTLGLPFIIVVLLIILSFVRTAPRGRRGGVIYVVVHELGDETRGIPAVEVRVAFPEPRVDHTDDRGGTLFTFPAEFVGREYSINASKAGYETRKPKRIKIVDGLNVPLVLKRTGDSHLTVSDAGKSTQQPEVPPSERPNSQTVSDVQPEDQFTGPSTFQAGGPVPADHFYGRAKQRAEIKATLQQKPCQCISIVGRRTIGKTSLLKYLKGRSSEFFLPTEKPIVVYLNGMIFGGYLGDVGLYQELQHQIAGSIGESPWANDANDNMEAVNAGLLELVMLGYRLIILIDEFEAIGQDLGRVEKFDEEWKNRVAEGLCTIFTATVYPLDVLATRWGSTVLQGRFDTITLGALEDNEWRKLVRDGYEYTGVNLSEDDIALIYDLAGGLPLFTQSAADILIHNGDHQATRKAFTERNQGYFENLFSFSEVYRNAIRYAAGVPRLQAPQMSVVSELQEYGILRPDGLLFSSVFAEYVRSRD